MNVSLLSVPLHGHHLMEASAGTGKTYTLTHLALRVLLEKKLPLSQILIVTYTEAATSEMKERFVDLLHEARRIVEGHSSNNGLLKDLLARHSDAKDILEDAQHTLDELAVFTIHGFCQRLLKEFAFDMSVFFDTELINDSHEYLEEATHAFWREHLQSSSREETQAYLQYLDPEEMLSFFKNLPLTPNTQLLPDVSEFSTLPLAESLKPLQHAFDELESLWSLHQSTIEHLMKAQPGWKKNYLDAWPAWLEHLPHYFHQKRPLDICKVGSALVFERLGNLSKGLKKGFDAPTHEFFEKCARFHEQQQLAKEAQEQLVLKIKRNFVDFVQTHYAQQKEQRQTHDFDDLLAQVHRALTGPKGDAFGRMLEKRFPVAFIDEFQDTDPIQYEILQKIYAASDNETSSALFLIGDPKQAIYGFRGADLFAYLQAQKQPHLQHHTLGVNWRSAPELVQALNHLFMSHPNPFVYEDIPYEPPQSAYDNTSALSDVLQFWWVAPQDDAGTKWLNKEQASQFIISTLAQHIAKQLNDPQPQTLVLKGEEVCRRVQPEDIAILVRKNQQAHELQSALEQYHIPCVVYQSENVFLTEEAKECGWLLNALENPADLKKLRAALTSHLFQQTAQDLEQLKEHPEVMEFWQMLFLKAHDLWKTHGFLAAWKSLVHAAPKKGLFQSHHAEIRYAHWEQLAELIDEESHKTAKSLSSLIQWFSQQRVQAESGQSGPETPMVSDASAVRIVTIHKSKGLEYPIVYCPFLWEGSRLDRADYLSFHHPETLKAYLDLGSSEWSEHLQWAQKEELAENLRLLYVALTRAQHQCVVHWGPIRSAESSALGYLLHGQDIDIAGEEGVSALKKHIKDQSPDDLEARIQSLSLQTEGLMSTRTLVYAESMSFESNASASQPLSLMPFSGVVDHRWRVSSFSGILSGKRASFSDHWDAHTDMSQSLDTDWDDLDARSSEVSEEWMPGLFPQGAAAGNALHLILEHCDFQQTDHTQIIEEVLRQYDFAASWVPHVNEWLNVIFQTPLMFEHATFCLADIALKQRVSEMEFHYPIELLGQAELDAMLQEAHQHWQIDEAPLEIQVSQMQGFMKGSIDLVFEHAHRFYFLDWKSNFLGAHWKHYDEEAMKHAMRIHGYPLQSLIYSKALHAYLQLRHPGYNEELHWGGGIYAFLRGMHGRQNTSGHGVLCK